MAANLAALRTLRELQSTGRPAKAEEQRTLAAWSSWGAVPGVFDTDKPEWEQTRTELRSLLSDAEWAAASRTTINAHYTDPAIVTEMWRALDGLGVTSGSVLEPGCGSGTFIGLAPVGVEATGVELDPTTAAIAQYLYPGASIRAESFADTRIPVGAFDAAIGNVPFGNVVLHDRAHNPQGLSLHNHFIVKSLDIVRPGGVAAFLTSSFTMDATNPAARREMAARADLIGAVRLPSGAHRRTAGTEALTDLLIFRRRPAGEPARDDGWVATVPVEVDGAKLRVNEYWANHPGSVLGEMRVGQGMYGAATVRVDGDLDGLPGSLARSLDEIVATARVAGLVATEREAAAPAPIAAAPDVSRTVGTVGEDGHGGFTVVTLGGVSPLAVPAAQRRELSALLSLRDGARELLAMEAASLDDSPELGELRATVADRYAAYVGKYGPINRYKRIETSRVDKETGEPLVQRRRPPVMKHLRTDPWASLIRGLELFDEVTMAAAPAAILSERVVVPRTPPLGVDTPGEAITVAMDTDGHLELARVATLLGVSETEARDLLGDLAFDDPESGALVPAAEYLSGDVRAKLGAARDATAAGGRFAGNVAALEAVLPRDLGADEISAQIGAVWISPADHQAFLRELLESSYLKVLYAGGASWEVQDAPRHSALAVSEWGTRRMAAGEIFQKLLEQKPVSVYDTDDAGRRVHNPLETEAASEKAGLMAERFSEWVWADPERAARLVAEYNRRFNSIVLRDYTQAGERMALPGVAASMSPRPHQRAAVARMVSEPAVGLFHEVGAGKTGEMVMGVMELKRLGLARKPVVVVPNHMLDQFSREWLQWYPQARVLAAGSDDLAGGARRDFVARVATGDWDGIVMTRTAFQKLDVLAETESAYLTREMESLREQLELAKGTGARKTVKQIEKRLITAEEKLKAKLKVPRDPGLAFEQTGIDYVVVDEAHAYKNLATVSSIESVSISGSKRASDLDMKIDYLRRRNGKRVVTFATATPIANSVAEVHVMTRLLRPDLLEAAGVEHFDRWAATFGKTVTELEMAPAGGKYREKTRFAQFQNVPEMLRMWHVFGDVKTAEDLNLPTPLLAAREDGQRLPETVLVEPSPELLEFQRSLAERADKLSGRSGRGEDNMLKVTGDGRRAALDMRLVGRGEPSGPQKLNVVAARIAKIWRDTRDNEYVDESGQVSPARGGLQIVFCDQSTPKADRWNAYNTLKSLLVEQGLEPKAVRFIHSAKSDTDKARLFAAARSGEVAVLLGSTEKMGVGTNVQARAVVLHHLDCPWRPADLAQRDGRIMRQGNQNPEVQIIRYVTGRSFDTYSWQTVERKAKFISQVMRGRLDAREMEDIGDAALSLAATKAIAADDPLILEKATVDGKVTKLARLERAHRDNEASLKWRAQAAQHRIAACDRDEPLIEAAIALTVPSEGDAFRAEFGTAGSTDSRVTAAERLRSAVIAESAWMARRDTLIEAPPIIIAGQRFTVTQRPGYGGDQGDYRLQIEGVPRTDWQVAGSTLSGIGVIRQMENRAARLPETLATLRSERAAAQRDLDQATRLIGAPFAHADELAAARLDKTRVDRLFAERAEQARGSSAAVATAQDGPAVPSSSGGALRAGARERALPSRDQHHRQPPAAAPYEPWQPGAGPSGGTPSMGAL